MKEVAQLEILFDDKKLVATLQEFSLVQKVNDHARLHFRGIVTDEATANKCITTKAPEALVKVYQLDTHPKSLIFLGQFTHIRKIVKGNVVQIEADALSTTWQLDLKKCNRSFQNQDLLLSELLKQILGSEDRFQLSSAFNGQTLKHFYLQYEETDWQFLIRMASQLNTVILADPIAVKPKIYFGLRDLKADAKPDQLNYLVVKDFAQQRILNENKDVMKANTGLDYYHIQETNDFFDLGAPVNFNHKTMLIFESNAVLTDSVIVNQCVITTAEGFKQQRLFNSKLAGVAVNATVKAIAKKQSNGKETSNQVDRVKVKFNFENETYDDAKAWLFPYATSYGSEGNTGWYCMPEPEDQVKIYFPGPDESKALVMTSVRQNATKRMEKPSVKYFRNSHGKEIVLGEDQIVLLGEDDKAGKVLIQLHEKKGVLIYSDKMTTIATTDKADINLTAGKDIKLLTPKRLTLKGSSANIFIDGAGGVTNINRKINFVHVPIGSSKPVKPKDAGNKPPASVGPQPTTPPKGEPKKDDNKHCHRHDDFLKELEQFPEDYRPALEKLHNKHIEWRFEAFKTEKDWNQFIAKQSQIDGDGNCKSLTTSSYSNWIVSNGNSQQDGWYPVKKEVISYFVDPRNFIISEIDIFQFLKLDNYDAETQTLKGVEKIFEGTELLKYAKTFIEAAENAKINAYYLASKCKLETGGGTCTLFKGTVPDLTVKDGDKFIKFNNKGYHNAYNINASQNKKDINVYKLKQKQSINKNGAQYAKDKGWTSEELAITGGASWCKDQFIGKGQDTMYSNKFDYISKLTQLHQYVQNIEAAKHEAEKYYAAYKNVSKLEEKLVFKIPIYDEMPTVSTKLISKK